MTRIVPKHGDLDTYEVAENGDLVVLGPAGDRLVVLNSVGAAGYELADGERDLDAISDIIASTLATPQEVVRADVDRFVRDLHERGLLSLVEQA